MKAATKPGACSKAAAAGMPSCNGCAPKERASARVKRLGQRRCGMPGARLQISARPAILAISPAAWLRLRKSWVMVEPQSAGVGIASEISDGVAVIRLTSPETANAFEPGDMLRLAAAIKTASCADSVRALILIGSGRHFCAGASFNGLAGAQNMDDLAQGLRRLWGTKPGSTANAAG